MRSPTAILQTLATLIVFALAPFAEGAQARDLGTVDAPLTLAKSLFPQADRYESQVRLINPLRSQAIASQLPSDVIYHELGTRVVYTVFRGSKPLGLLHIRHERGEWGLTQIAWALETDLTIIDFSILHSRDPEHELANSPLFRANLVGQDLETLLERDFQSKSNHGERRDSFARTVTNSALKCLAATQVAWQFTAVKLRIGQTGYTQFPDATSVRFAPGVRSSDALNRFERDGLGTLSPTLRNSLILAHAFDAKGARLGSITHVHSTHGQAPLPILFTVEDSELVATTPLLASPESKLHSELALLHGKGIEELLATETVLAHSAALAISASNQSHEANEDL